MADWFDMAKADPSYKGQLKRTLLHIAAVAKHGEDAADFFKICSRSSHLQRGCPWAETYIFRSETIKAVVTVAERTVKRGYVWSWERQSIPSPLVSSEIANLALELEDRAATPRQSLPSPTAPSAKS